MREPGNLGIGEVSATTDATDGTFGVLMGPSMGGISGRSGEGGGFVWVVPLPDAFGVS